MRHRVDTEPTDTQTPGTFRCAPDETGAGKVPVEGPPSVEGFARHVHLASELLRDRRPAEAHEYVLRALTIMPDNATSSSSRSTSAFCATSDAFATIRGGPCRWFACGGTASSSSRWRPFLALDVRGEDALSLRTDTLIGWIGLLAPELTNPRGSAPGEFITFSGEGTVLFQGPLDD